MKIEVLEEHPQKLRFILREASTGLANALRRTVIARLPSFAVEDVDFYENNSVLVNEYLANRLALVPLTWDENAADDAKISFTLQVEGPGVATSGDLKSADDKIRVFNEKIPIVKLGEKQRVRLEATAVKGIGKTHAKFQNALAAYGALPKVEGHKDTKKRETPCPNHPKNPEIVCLDCAESLGIDVELDAHPADFLFTLESYTDVTARGQLERAVRLLENQIVELKKELK